LPTINGKRPQALLCGDSDPFWAIGYTYEDIYLEMPITGHLFLGRELIPEFHPMWRHIEDYAINIRLWVEDGRLIVAEDFSEILTKIRGKQDELRERYWLREHDILKQAKRMITGGFPKLSRDIT
ncbi:MAG: hypothetical protein AAFQ07_12160, partial [Chloroflexota bacterium]